MQRLVHHEKMPSNPRQNELDGNQYINYYIVYFIPFRKMNSSFFSCPIITLSIRATKV